MQKILTIDIGNTLTKLGVFEDGNLVHSTAGRGLGSDEVESMLDCHTIEGIAYCRVGKDEGRIAEWLEECGLPYVKVDCSCKMPLKLDYDTPGSLGADRIAAAVGATETYGSALVVDAGTAVTSDLVCGGVFRGGNISPGLSLRFRSLHQYTSALPLVCREGELPEFGYDTETAIRAGVVRGLVAELKADFEAALFIDKNVKMILTGGDAAFLKPLLEKEEIAVTVVPDAVGRGLVRIFNYNYDL